MLEQDKDRSIHFKIRHKAGAAKVHLSPQTASHSFTHFTTHFMQRGAILGHKNLQKRCQLKHLYTTYQGFRDVLLRWLVSNISSENKTFIEWIHTHKSCTVGVLLWHFAEQLVVWIQKLHYKTISPQDYEGLCHFMTTRYYFSSTVTEWD